MPDKIENLKTLISVLTHNTNIHICIHDVSGILTSPLLKIPLENTIHSAKICNIAKTSEKGMNACLSCKMKANKKAIDEKKLYWGMCVNGLTEIVRPVIVNSKILCIIYIGNIIVDQNETRKILENNCQSAKINPDLMFKELNSAHFCDDIDIFKTMSGIIQSYIFFIYNSYPVNNKKDTHWAVNAFKKYAHAYYNKNINLSQLAKLYYVNEKYIGRIFKKQEGISFNTYLKNIRINQACKLLTFTNHNIIDISLSIGFNNVTYFNRIFKNFMKMTPSEYRETKKSDNLLKSTDF